MTLGTLLDFGVPGLTVQVFSHQESVQIADKAYVMNVGAKSATIDVEPIQTIASLESTILQDVAINSGETHIVVVRVDDFFNYKDCSLRWPILANTIKNPSNDIAKTPLHISQQFSVAKETIDLGKFTIGSDRFEDHAMHEVRINLWYAPPHTDCIVHNKHCFVEKHLQIYGVGRMQQFRYREAEIPYAEIPMPVGGTHEVFAFTPAGDGSLTYPWHRYFSDTHCVWMAIEYHDTRTRIG